MAWESGFEEWSDLIRSVATDRELGGRWARNSPWSLVVSRWLKWWCAIRHDSTNWGGDQQIGCFYLSRQQDGVPLSIQNCEGTGSAEWRWNIDLNREGLIEYRYKSVWTKRGAFQQDLERWGYFIRIGGNPLDTKLNKKKIQRLLMCDLSNIPLQTLHKIASADDFPLAETLKQMCQLTRLVKRLIKQDVSDCLVKGIKNLENCRSVGDCSHCLMTRL